MKSTQASSIILFDGVCNLCNSLVIFLIKRDRKNVFKFTALQSPQGQQILKKHELKTDAFDSFVLYQKDTIYQKSSAGIRVLSKLGGLWSLFKIFLIVPRPIRDFVYSIIAKNRYNWWGKKDQCMIPTPELQKKFL